MSKKVLAIYYSQSGQLKEIVDNFTTPFTQSGMTVEKVQVKPKKDFGFPWTSERFFDAMPESVLAVPVELENFELKESSYDLIILAYQPWYLSPSIPVTSALIHPSLKKVLKNTPVVTLIGARNMWLNAQERVKKILEESGAHLVGNVALVDKNSNLISAVTILYWMLTGKKDKYLGIFPKPGVANEDILNSKKFGTLAKDSLVKGDLDGLQKNLVETKALEVNSDLMFIEARAPKLFSVWANIIIKKKNRGVWLILFKYYLLIALFMVAPVVLAINSVLFRPFFGNRIQKKKMYYLGLN
jgi:hypothetical protein